jgi:Transposase DDE domain
VAKRLTAGQVTLVTISGWGFVGDFLAFLDEIGFCALLGIDGRGFKRVMIPIARLVMTYQMKVLLGIGSINLVPAKMFRQVALMKLIGYTTTEMQVGFCQRGHLAAGPMHKNTLADGVERLSSEELEQLLNETTRRLVAKGFFKDSKGHFALDATDLETTAKYEGAGVKKYTEWRVDKETKKPVEVERFVHGFKVLVVYEVHLRLVVAAKVVPIGEHESKFTLALVRQAVKNLGGGVLRVLLMDRGFLDGRDLWVLKADLGIDFVVPSKDNMRVTGDARELCRRAADGECVFKAERKGRKKVDKAGKERWQGQVSVVGVAGLTSYDQYGDEGHIKQANRKDFVGNDINAVAVTKWQGEEYRAGEEKVFLSSLPVQAPLEVLDLYDLRSLIENTAFRELKQGWNLKSYPKKTAAAVTGHVFLTLLTFTLAGAFRSSRGQELAKHGIRRQRAEQHDENVIVFAGDYYAIFHIEEVFILLGVVPEVLLRADPREFSRRYGLALAA